MKKHLLALLLLCFSVSINAQNGFQLTGNKKKNRIPFELVNNLPVIKVTINGKDFSLLLDTGVNATILFSPDSRADFKGKMDPIQIRGLGSGGSLSGIKTGNNIIKVGNAVDVNHELYLIFDTSLNFSPRMGIPVEGILGNSFFRNFVVKINYSSKTLIIYDPERYSVPSCKKCMDLPVDFVDGKPYINLMVSDGTTSKEVTLLVDSGSSDALWLFDEENYIQEQPKNYFEDFLGLGLSGNISGKRAKVPELVIAGFKMKNVTTSFPEEAAIKKALLYAERDGSVGGGLLSRFNIIFDYRNKMLHLKKNSNFNRSVNYNMSGLTLEHSGMDWLLDKFKISLIPRYVVVDVREGSPAEIAGVKIDDEILSINGRPNYSYKLYQLIELFSTEEGKKITLEIRRGEVNKRMKFYLKSVFK